MEITTDTFIIEFDASERGIKNFKSYVWVNGQHHYHTGRNKKSLRGATNQARREAKLLFNYYVKTRDYDHVVVVNKATGEIENSFDINQSTIKKQPTHSHNNNALYGLVTEWLKTKTRQEVFNILTLSGVSVVEANDLVNTL